MSIPKILPKTFLAPPPPRSHLRLAPPESPVRALVRALSTTGFTPASAAAPVAFAAPARSGSSVPWLSQRHPDGVASPGYAKALDPGSACAPTCLAMIAKSFGIEGSGDHPNEALVERMWSLLGSKAGAGTGAAAIPGAAAALGLQSAQIKASDGPYPYATFWKGYRALDPAGKTQAMNDLRGYLRQNGVTDDQMKALTPDGLRDKAEGIWNVNWIASQVEAGHPVMVGTSYGALHGGGGAGHYVVVTGVERDAAGHVTGFSVNDPDPRAQEPSFIHPDPSCPGSYSIPADRLWAAMAANCNHSATAIWK
jgi:hypothetical protein